MPLPPPEPRQKRILLLKLLLLLCVLGVLAAGMYPIYQALMRIAGFAPVPQPPQAAANHTALDKGPGQPAWLPAAAGRPV
jgi:cytochrome c oxidase assembly protein subunit 11